MEQDLEHVQNLVKNHPPPSSSSSTSSSIPNSTSSSNLTHSSPSLSANHASSAPKDSSERLTGSHPIPVSSHSHSYPIPLIDVDDSDKKDKKSKKKDRLKKQPTPKSPKVSQREVDNLGKSPKSSLLTEEMMQRNNLFKERQRSQSVCTELPYPVAASIGNNGNYSQRIENLTKRTQALREGADLPGGSSPIQIEQQGSILSVKEAIASIEQKSHSPAPKGMMDRINQLKQNAASSINVHAIEDSVGYYSSSAPASPSLSNNSPAPPPSSDVPPSSSPVNSSVLQKRTSKNDPLGGRKNSGQKSNPNSGEYEPLPKTFSNSKLDINLLKKEDLISKFKSGWHCKICSKIHTEVPLFLCCAFPNDYDELAAQEKEVRSKISSDLCSIDNVRFFVRGLLEIPIISPSNAAAPPESKSGSGGGGGGSGKNQAIKPPVLTFIPWILVESSDFFKIMEKWKDSDCFTVNGVLNNNLPIYGDTIGTPVTLTTRQNGLRPLVVLSHPDKAPSVLAKDISDGINISRLESIFETLLHS